MAPLLLAGNRRSPGVVGVGPPTVDSRRATAGGGVVYRVEDVRRLPVTDSGVGERVAQCDHRRLWLLLLDLRLRLGGLGTSGSLEEPAGRGPAAWPVWT